MEGGGRMIRDVKFVNLYCAHAKSHAVNEGEVEKQDAESEVVGHQEAVTSQRPDV